MSNTETEAQLMAEGDLVADYLEELLDIADLDGDIENSVQDGRAHVAIDTESELLVGKDGEVLDALQELSRLVVMTETRLGVGVCGVFFLKTKDAIAEVKETGEPVAMAPLNAYERKIIHDEVAAAGLVSESEGEPPRRRVVVRAS